MANRLSNEKSLYLKQHEKNPIHWWAYSEEAIAEAKKKNLLIFLSIGYSACHWCHVMAHESFEDQATADFLNQNYICIKVDREEFPDIDQYYQKACQGFGRNGGWPLSAFLTPEMKPLFIGTYFPKERRKEMPSFMDVLNELKKIYESNNQEMFSNADKIKAMVEAGPVLENKVEFQGHFPPPAAVLNALKNFQDNEFGGYGAAPKFPHFAFYEWALEQMLEGTVAQDQGQFILESLEKMMMGGVYDHLRGGIHRYSTDKMWMVPHFEKMLYDQAGLLRVLTKASIMYPTPLFFDAIIQTLDYLQNEMLHEQKYFMSAQDADSEGMEGLYFTFSKEEVLETLVNSENQKLIDNKEKILDWMNITDTANFEQGLSVISLNINKRNEIYERDNWELLREAKQVLLENRKCRIPPATDSKGIASWNFMIVSALIDVIQYSRLDPIRSQATSLLNMCLDSIHVNFLVQKDNSTIMRHSTTKASTLSYFEDYACFAEMQVRLYEITSNQIFKQNALDAISFIFKEFYKDGYFYTRAIATDKDVNYGNIPTPILDGSFKSPLSNFISLIRRVNILAPEEKWLEKMSKVNELVLHTALQHPIAAGEALRAFTYPDEIYRKIEVPKNWLRLPEFNQFMPSFASRFMLEYHDREDNSWQICNNKVCEVTGTTIEEFIDVFTPEEETAQPEKQ